MIMFISLTVGLVKLLIPIVVLTQEMLEYNVSTIGNLNTMPRGITLI